jgi:DAACS family dicarboxylate/amino acid:cation (Na+ or H+) symporter
MSLHNKILLGLAAGAVVGGVANAFAAGAPWLEWLAENVAGPAGQIFLRLLLMTVVPLVFASVVLGVAGLGDIRKVGRIGGMTLGYFLISTLIGVIIGVVLVNVLDPGSRIDAVTRADLLTTYQAGAGEIQERPVTFGVQTLVNIVPRNPLRAAVDMDMLAVIFVSLIFGGALTLIPAERARPMIAVLEALGDVVIKIVELAMALAPYGVFALVFVVASRFGWHLLEILGMYVVVVLLGLFLHAAVVQSLLVRFLGRMNPLHFWSRIRASMVTAFSTSSSNATLPTNIAVAETQLGIDPKVAGFVLPLGATMNMNGTALYEGVTVLFLAQVFSIDLTVGQQVVVVLLSVLTAVGAAGVPGGSLPLILLVMGAVGVPAEALALILGVDRVLDMCRSTVNVTGDLTAAVFVDRMQASGEGERLGAAPTVPGVDR